MPTDMPTDIIGFSSFNMIHKGTLPCFPRFEVAITSFRIFRANKVFKVFVGLMIFVRLMFPDI